jgi:MFS family permease
MCRDVYPFSLGTVCRFLVGKGGARRAALSRNVVFLGLTSFWTDLSAELVTSVLPIYLLVHLQLSPATFGVIDGLHQAGNALARLFGGYWSDRWQRYKRVAAIGYALSTVSRLALLVPLGGSWFAGVTLVDRFGKGVRTAPRDAMISLSVAPRALGTAFGLHRALDTAGAMLGPLLAFVLMRFTDDAFDAVFLVSFLVGVVGLVTLLAFVSDPAGLEPSAVAPSSSDTTAPEPVAKRNPAAWKDVTALLSERRFRTLVACSGALGAVTIGDAFLYLVLQHRYSFATGNVPLLYLATPLVYTLLALPLGRLADRVGRMTMLLAGHAALGLGYVVVSLPLSAALGVGGAILCLGAYYAATDGVLMALASPLLPARLRASGLAWVATLNLLGKFVASAAFGLVWTQLSELTAMLLFAACLGVTVALFDGTRGGRPRGLSGFPIPVALARLAIAPIVRGGLLEPQPRSAGSAAPPDAPSLEVRQERVDGLIDDRGVSVEHVVSPHDGHRFELHDVRVLPIREDLARAVVHGTHRRHRQLVRLRPGAELRLCGGRLARCAVQQELEHRSSCFEHFVRALTGDARRQAAAGTPHRGHQQDGVLGATVAQLAERKVTVLTVQCQALSSGVHEAPEQKVLDHVSDDRAALSVRPRRIGG